MAGVRNRVVFSYLGFFFTYFYLLALGLWRKAAVWFLINMALVAVSLVLWPDSSLWTPFFIALGAGPATRVNVYYYDLKVKGEQTWAL